MKITNTKSSTQTQLVAKLQLAVSTLRAILKNREEIEGKYRLGGMQRKKQMVGKCDKIQKVLVKWHHKARALKLRISCPIIAEKVRKIGENYKFLISRLQKAG